MRSYAGLRLKTLTPYVPGEQPQDRRYLKLNTNESPFSPPASVIEAASKAAENLQLYSDPACKALRQKLAEVYHVDPDEVICTGGSDELLNFAVMAFCDEDTPAVFPDITYGFYKVFAAVNRVAKREVSLKEDLSIDPTDYFRAGGLIMIANPNAPTGLVLPLSDIERILENNPDHVVLIDEAYIDFGGESAVPLIRRYPNLLVVQTFSKSRSLAGGRLGFGIASKGLIRDLNTVRNSTNPYDVSSMTMAAGLAFLEEETETARRCRMIMENRTFLTEGLRNLGFILSDSETNFVFARHPAIGGKALYSALRERGILVRHFDAERTREYVRITIGTHAQMEQLLDVLKEVLQ